MRSREEGGSVDRSGGIERERLREFGSGKSRSSHGGEIGTDSLLFLFRPMGNCFVSLFFVDGLYKYICMHRYVRSGFERKANGECRDGLLERERGAEDRM